MSEPSDAEEALPEDADDDGDEAPAAPARPRRKRKKTRKKRARTAAQNDAENGGADEEASEAGAGDGAEGGSGPDDTPLPGEGTADGDRLRLAHRHFEVGDYAAVRKETRALEDADDPAVAAAARRLRQRVEVDPIQIVVLSCCAAVVAAIVYVWIL